MARIIVVASVLVAGCSNEYVPFRMCSGRDVIEIDEQKHLGRIDDVGQELTECRIEKMWCSFYPVPMFVPKFTNVKDVRGEASGIKFQSIYQGGGYLITTSRNDEKYVSYYDTRRGLLSLRWTHKGSVRDWRRCQGAFRFGNPPAPDADAEKFNELRNKFR